jgi:tRNA(fMet)-specific endonuclease VapC
MSYLLDTNICSAHFRRPGGLAHRFVQYSGRIFVSSVVLGELYAGAFHVDNPVPLLGNIEDLLQDVSLLSFDGACAEQFGRLRGGLLRQGVSVPTFDLMIGATAIVHDLTLVTHNTADFKNIPGLRLEDWLRN